MTLHITVVDLNGNGVPFDPVAVARYVGCVKGRHNFDVNTLNDLPTMFRYDRQFLSAPWAKAKHFRLICGLLERPFVTLILIDQFPKGWENHPDRETLMARGSEQVNALFAEFTQDHDLILGSIIDHGTAENLSVYQWPGEIRGIDSTTQPRPEPLMSVFQ